MVHKKQSIAFLIAIRWVGVQNGEKRKNFPQDKKKYSRQKKILNVPVC